MPDIIGNRTTIDNTSSVFNSSFYRGIFVDIFCLINTRLFFKFDQSAENRVLNTESALHNELSQIFSVFHMAKNCLVIN